MNKITKGLTLLSKIIKSDRMHARFFYILMKNYVQTDDKIVLYESFHGRSMTGNPYALFLKIMNDTRFENYMHVWILDDPYSKRVWKTKRVKLIKRNSFQHIYFLLKSKYIISNTSLASYISKKLEQVYINTWHGTPIKTLGDDIVDNLGSGHNITRNFLQTDFLVLPNQYTVQRLLKAFNIDELYTGTIIENGYPRIDLSFKTKQEQHVIKLGLKIRNKKKVILYAPTYRGEQDSLNDERTHIEELLGALHSNYHVDYTILYKGHYFQSLDLGYLNIISIDSSYDTNELLSIVDVLITDYSSVAFDFITLKRPIIYYSYDLAQYTQERGLYFELEKMPGSLCSSVDDVMKALKVVDTHMRQYVSEYEKAFEKYCKYDDGNVSQKIIDVIFFRKIKDTHVYKIPKNTKKKMLLYGGGFLNNGVTSSLLSLLAHLDYTKYEVSLISNSNPDEVNFKRVIPYIPESVKIIHIRNTGLKLFQPLYKIMSLKKLERIFRQEFYDLLGSSKFDIAIDYSGYGSYWSCFIAFSNAKLKCIYLHNDMRKEQQKRPHLADYNLLYTLYRNMYDKLITVSDSSYKANKKSFLDIEKKIVNVNNVIDYKSIIFLSKKEDLAWKSSLDVNKINFINIARYSVEKGQDRLIQAFSHIARKNSNVHLYVVGHGVLYKTLESQIINLGLEQFITLTDNIENPFPLLSSCDCFILSSHYEGQGLVLLESMVLGIPCISTDIPGPQSVLADNHGLLVEDSVEGLISGMETYLEGDVPQQVFDYKQYTQKAIRSFYKAVT